MQQFDNGIIATADAFPPLIGSSGYGGGVAALGPSMQGQGVLLSTYNQLIDLQLLLRDPAAGGGTGFKLGAIIQGLAPGGFAFPAAIGFRARSHVAGSPALMIAQVWDLQDGPLPQTPLSPNVQTLSTSGVIGVAVVIPTVPLASWPPLTPVDGQTVYIILPSTYDPIGGKTIRWLASYSSADNMWHVTGAPIVVKAASTTLVPHAGDYIVSGKGFQTGGNGSTTGSNQAPLNLTVGGVTVDTQDTANVPSAAASAFSYGGAGSTYGVGGFGPIEVDGMTAGETVAIPAFNNNPIISIAPLRLANA